jgi:hypothetical protein
MQSAPCREKKVPPTGDRCRLATLIPPSFGDDTPHL